MKVRIKSLGLPKAAYGQQANYGLSLSSPDSAGSIQSAEHMMKPGLKPKRTIGGVPREEANLEAEGGESVVGQISGDGIVDHMSIKGPRHGSGGVPLSLPDDSFIFSDTASMKIKDPKILQMFGKKKGSYTPAELAKPYDISKYKAILMDPDTDRLSRTTAEIMIKNIVMKLGALALAQEAKKGFPQGIPEIAKPYMEANGITEEDLIPELRAQAEQMQAMQQQAMQMQQAQGMQQPQMQQQGPPQGMPQMMPDGQPIAMPQQGMGMPQEPMMDPRQMMAMQQEQQMMPPQPQQGMPMAKEGLESEIEFSKIDTRRMLKGKPVNMLKYPTKYNQPHDSHVYGVREINTTTDNGALDRNTMGTFVVDNTFPDGTGNTQYSGSQDGKRYTYNTDNDFAYYDGQKVDRRPDLEEAIGGMAGYVSNQRFGGTPMAGDGMQKFAPGGTKDPCPNGFYWNENTGECEPMAEGLPTIKDINSNPILKEALEYLEYKRNIENYQNNYRKKQWRKFLDENYDGPNDRNNDEYQKLINSADYLKFMETVPHMLEEDFELPSGYKQKTFYDEKDNWMKDEKSKEYFNELFNPNIEEWEQEELNKNKPEEIKINQPGGVQQLRIDEWCPCYKQEEKILASGESVIEKVCVPCESQPMAAYGMQLGGFDMPFIMGNGGMMRYHNGGTGPGHPHGDETVEDREAQEVTDWTEEGGREGTTDQSGYESRTYETSGAERGSGTYYSGGRGTEAGVAGGICKKIRESNNLEELFYIEGGNPPFPAYLKPSGITPADPGYPEALSAAIAKLKANPLYTDCIQNVEDATAPTIRDEYIAPVEDVTEKICGCVDPENPTKEDGSPNYLPESIKTWAELGIEEGGKCPDAMCEETTEIIEERKLDNEIAPLPVIPAVSFRRGVADPIKTSPDLVGGLDGSYLEYKTAVQNDQGALEKQIAAIKTMPGVSIGQKQAMIAQVQSQSKAPSIITDVYNKNVDTDNRIEQAEYQGELGQQQLQAGIDSQYNQALSQARNQETMNVNAARQYRAENAKDNMRMQMMAQSINNASENFDALGNYLGNGTPLQKQQMLACINAGNSLATCAAKILGTTTPSETPSAAPEAAPESIPTARYGRIVNPYVMASSVYPWSK